MATRAYAPRPIRQRKGLAIAALVVGILSFLTFGCLLVGALTGLVLGIVALVKAGRHPQEYGGKGLAWGGVVLSGISLLFIPIVVAIAIPSLLKARVSANEAAAIGDVRTLISAETAYQASNAGFFEGRLECLADPGRCIPGYAGGAFIDSTLTSSEPKSGYLRRLHPGPAIDAVEPPDSERRRQASPSSVTSFAYVAVPVRPGNTGIRGFCGDSTGQICRTPDGSAPRVQDGVCDLSSCEALY